MGKRQSHNCTFMATRNLAFEKMLNTFMKRHHLRLWRTAATTANGRDVWMGASTHDIGLDVHLGVISHAIDPDLTRSETKSALTSWQAGWWRPNNW